MRLTVSSCVLTLIATAEAVLAATDAEKCEVAKNKIAGKYAFCRQSAEAKAIKTGTAPDYATCDIKFADKWASAEADGGAMCPTDGDQSSIQDQIIACADQLALQLSGVRFVDNGDGTVTDVTTGLMWEQKNDAGGIHDKDNFYTWSSTGTAPDGTVFTVFLGTLNNGTSADGITISGCFAGVCDWRLATIAELAGIIDPTQGACGGGSGACIDPIFGPASSRDWSGTTDATFTDYAWAGDFPDGVIDPDSKTLLGGARAVRGAY